MSKKEDKPSIFKNGYLAAGIVVGLEILAMALLFENENWVFLIPTIGILTFFGVMIVANLFSNNNDIQKGEMRISIAASLLIVYFLLLSFTLFAKEDVSVLQKFNQGNQCSEETQNCPENATTVNDILNGMLDNYNTLIMTVIAFYFGGRSIEVAAKTISDNIVNKASVVASQKAEAVDGEADNMNSEKLE